MSLQGGSGSWRAVGCAEGMGGFEGSRSQFGLFFSGSPSNTVRTGGLSHEHPQPYASAPSAARLRKCPTTERAAREADCAVVLRGGGVRQQGGNQRNAVGSDVHERGPEAPP